jgi:hypothetical protein
LQLFLMYLIIQKYHLRYLMLQLFLNSQKYLNYQKIILMYLLFHWFQCRHHHHR